MSGERIGPYLIERRLGIGGMAEVFLAKKSLGAAFGGVSRFVVVKRMLRELAEDERFVEMFRREAGILAHVRHPNVVRIYDFGTTDDGQLFIAMEYLDGTCLYDLAERAWRQQRALPIELGLRVVAEAARGLHHVHTLRDPRTGGALGLVHRDIAPDNLILVKDGGVKLVDFGVARSAAMKPLTRKGEIKGKVPFMAPEVLNGAELDGRADLFALGVCAYWLFTGARPFRGRGDAEVIRAILDTAPARPSTLNASLPRWLDDLVLGLLEKERARRTATGAEVDEEIARRAGSSLDVEADVAFVRGVLQTATVQTAERPPPRGATPRNPGSVADISPDLTWELTTAAAVPRAELPPVLPPSAERTQRRRAPPPPPKNTGRRRAPAPVTMPSELHTAEDGAAVAIAPAAAERGTAALSAPRPGDTTGGFDHDGPTLLLDAPSLPVPASSGGKAPPLPRAVVLGDTLPVSEEGGDTMRLTESQLGLHCDDASAEEATTRGAAWATRAVPQKKGKQ